MANDVLLLHDIPFDRCSLFSRLSSEVSFLPEHVHRLHSLLNIFSFLCHLAMPPPRNRDRKFGWFFVGRTPSSSVRPHLKLVLICSFRSRWTCARAHSCWRSGHSLNTHRADRHGTSQRPTCLVLFPLGCGGVLPRLPVLPVCALAAALPACASLSLVCSCCGFAPAHCQGPLVVSTPSPGLRYIYARRRACHGALRGANSNSDIYGARCVSRSTYTARHGTARRRGRSFWCPGRIPVMRTPNPEAHGHLTGTRGQ